MVNKFITEEKKNKMELTFYTKLPISEIQYEDFKKISEKRISMFKKWEKENNYLYTITDQEEDDMSHASLKLVCSTKEDLTNWFVNNEVKLLKMRCERHKEKVKEFFIKKIWPYLNIIEGNINSETQFDLENSNSVKFDNNINIHFTKCSEILPKREFEIKKGYFKMNDLIIEPFILSEYKNYLIRKMKELKEDLHSDDDERLAELEKELFSKEEYELSETKNINENLNLFPPCMRGLLNKFVDKSHLKYFDRQVLCRFLKDIGVPMEETINMFRTNFKIPENVFKREYLYGIRHNYGMEGKRASYKSFTCYRIIDMSNNNEIFGCPFVNNHDYVRENYDIEEIGQDYIKNCMECGFKKLGTEDTFKSPAEYFRLMKNAKNKLNP